MMSPALRRRPNDLLEGAVESTPSEVLSMAQLRSKPREWHRRGMRHPTELARMVADRVAQDVSPDARYEDFLIAPNDEDPAITANVG